jgi:predicted site-specific integrase-resolvase
MRVAIYARVSTDDKGQDPENQLQELRAWALNSGHAITGEYVDYESGRKSTEKRKQFAVLFDDAAKRKFNCALAAFSRPQRLAGIKVTPRDCRLSVERIGCQSSSFSMRRHSSSKSIWLAWSTSERPETFR